MKFTAALDVLGSSPPRLSAGAKPLKALCISATGIAETDLKTNL